MNVHITSDIDSLHTPYGNTAVGKFILRRDRLDSALLFSSTPLLSALKSNSVTTVEIHRHAPVRFSFTGQGRASKTAVLPMVN